MHFQNVYKHKIVIKITIIIKVNIYHREIKDKNCYYKRNSIHINKANLKKKFYNNKSSKCLV